MKQISFTYKTNKMTQNYFHDLVGRIKMRYSLIVCIVFVSCKCTYQYIICVSGGIISMFVRRTSIIIELSHSITSPCFDCSFCSQTNYYYAVKLLIICTQASLLAKTNPTNTHLCNTSAQPHSFYNDMYQVPTLHSHLQRCPWNYPYHVSYR